MDIDYLIKNNQVYLTLKESLKEKAKKRRKMMSEAEDNLWKMASDRINDKTGDC